MSMSVLPPGFRFHPTDEELVAHYLKRKATGRSLEEGVIAEIDLYKFEPSELPGLSILPSRDPEWYFFNLQDRKYLHGSRTNRTTKAGYWKATGKDRKISTANQTVGLKKTLIYYRGRAPNGERTDWVMHEYRLDEEFEKRIGGVKNPFVLCRVRRKQGPGPRNGEQYGAPVLESVEDDEDSPDDVKDVPALEFNKDFNVEIGSKSPSQVLEYGSSFVDNVEDLDYFLDSIASFEDQPGSIDFPSTVSDNFNFADTEGHLEPVFDSMAEMRGSPIENLHSMLHRAENEAEMLEELLDEIVDGGEIVNEPIKYSNDGASGIGVNADESFALDEFGDFFELADLQDYQDDSVSGLPSLDLSDIGSGVDHITGIQTQVDAEWIPEIFFEQGTAVRRVRLQVDSPDYDFEQKEMPIIPKLKDRAQEVLPDGSRDFSDANHSSKSVIDRENSSPDFVTDDDLLSTSETRMIGGSVAVLESLTDISLQGSLSSSQNFLQEQKDNDASTSQVSVLSSDQPHTDDEPIPSLSNPLSPASFLSIVLGFLENVPALPASALELKSQNIGTTNQTDSPAESSSQVMKPLLHQRMAVSRSNKLLESDRFNKLDEPDRCDKLLTYDHESPECKYGGRRRVPCKGCRNSGISLFLFSLATTALILFCLFRGFFKFTRCAFAFVM